MDPDTLREVGREPHGGADDPDLLDFSANVNPETPDGVAEVYESALADCGRYPPEPPRGFVEAAAEYVGVDPGLVVPTPGGMAAIRLAVEATVRAGDSVAVPAPSFGEYAREVRLQGAEPVFVDHDRIVDVDPAGHGLVIVCNPNNPTGTAYDDGALRDLAERCREADSTLLVDEAFLDFTERPSLAGTPGTVVARSLTKVFGLPGLRAGFAVATGSLRDALLAGRQTWNIGAPALAVGTHCLGETTFVEATRDRVRRERARMREALREHFDVHPSEAPFLLLDVGDRAVCEVVDTARDRGVAIRDATTFRALDRHVRVAVRLPAENDRLQEVLADV